jgi:hypothetical protein
MRMIDPETLCPFRRLERLREQRRQFNAPAVKPYTAAAGLDVLQSSVV